MTDYDRRIILYFLVLISVAIAASTFYILLSNDTNDAGNTDIITESQQMMGTIVTIEIVGSGPDAQGAINSAFDEIDRIEKLMSTYDPKSEISILNTEGKLNNASEDFIYVIKQSLYYGDISSGSFDITIKPILNLWKSKISAGEFPTGQDINETLLLVNYSNISINDDTVSFKTEGMCITVDGIAKGYAVDQAVAVLKNSGYSSGFVNAGGDGMYFGTKPDGTKWNVGLRNPEDKSESVVVMEISDMAVATSGNYERYFNESARLSHISDPRTGISSEGLLSATVIASSAMEADTLATAVFVSGPDNGLEIIENTENTECFLITPEGQILISSGFDSYLSTTE
ncbi:MAG: FAD:protein FMN transferase [ANME-2 cluster archaeon]|jgi:thiamine biosynthesis lipoprotein|nr:FAD:protein FMN transferase [ANME-2 cluster archaeon]